MAVLESTYHQKYAISFLKSHCCSRHHIHNSPQKQVDYVMVLNSN